LTKRRRLGRGDHARVALGFVGRELFCRDQLVDDAVRELVLLGRRLALLLSAS